MNHAYLGTVTDCRRVLMRQQPVTKFEPAVLMTMVLAETTGTETIYYLHGLDLVAQNDGVNTEYFGYDGLGSVRQMLDSSGSVLFTQAFDPYGNLYYSAGTNSTSWGFTGEQTDAYIKLIYLRARWYTPQIGRFMSRDLWQGDYTRPLSLNGWNYGYANPINFTDPSGFDPLDRKWQDDFQKRTGREPAFEDVMARLFEVTYPKEWNWEDFYNSDGSIDIEEYVRKLTAPPSSRSWEDFPQALTRLASNYNIDEKDIFVRDVGTLYAGLPTRFGTRSFLLPVNTIISLLRSWGGTGQTSAYLSRSGLPPEWIGTDRDSNVHH
jgi:RHS repeat-associated protein